MGLDLANLIFVVLNSVCLNNVPFEMVYQNFDDLDLEDSLGLSVILDLVDVALLTWDFVDLHFADLDLFLVIVTIIRQCGYSTSDVTFRLALGICVGAGRHQKLLLSAQKHVVSSKIQVLCCWYMPCVIAKPLTLGICPSAMGPFLANLITVLVG